MERKKWSKEEFKKKEDKKEMKKERSHEIMQF